MSLMRRRARRAGPRAAAEGLLHFACSFATLGGEMSLKAIIERGVGRCRPIFERGEAA